jgi:hypothetical protein
MAVSACAKEKSEPSITMMWPDPGPSTLKVVFGRFVQQAFYNGQRSFVSSVIVQNVSTKRIPRASLSVRFFDKDKIRIGDSVLNVNDLGPGESTKVAFQFFSTGMPVSLLLTAHNDASGVPTSLKTIALKIESVPAGAKLKVDGQDSGTTPKVVDLLVGNHLLEFSKEGYATSSTPLDIKPDEAPGGTITIELGGLSVDTIELRDGSVLQGDVVSVSMSSVLLRIKGVDQSIERNRVKRILLVERETVEPQAIPVSTSK